MLARRCLYRFGRYISELGERLQDAAFAIRPTIHRAGQLVDKELFDSAARDLDDLERRVGERLPEATRLRALISFLRD